MISPALPTAAWACVNAGLKVVVTLGAPSSSISTDVVVIDADTRGLGPARCYRAGCDQLVQQYARDPDLLLFKKIDSTLRGHLGMELAAVLEARSVVAPRSVAIMAPAFPTYGRTTVEGRQYVYGKLLHETEIWKSEKAFGRRLHSWHALRFGIEVCSTQSRNSARGSHGV